MRLGTLTCLTLALLASACTTADVSSGASTSGGSTSANGSTGSMGTGSSSGSPGAGASSGGSGSVATFPAGNPSGSCTTLALPAEAQPVDTRQPTSVVGTGTAASCTFAALQSAVSGGGIITFDCGPEPVTIPVTATLNLPTSTGDTPLHIVIDGNSKVTLDGRHAVQILSWIHDTWRTSQDTLTLQNLALINGKTAPQQAIPACPASGGISNTACSQGYDDGEGGALYMQDGNLRVINCVFGGNEAALLGPDTGGGAIYLFGTGSPSYIVQSTFQNNRGANAGAIGMLWAGAYIFNSLFEGNGAVGNGANNDDASQCTCMNNGQNEIGSGGNGGAIYKDGADEVDLIVCGDLIEENSANEFGAAIFLTADGSGANLVIDDTVIRDNPSPIDYWQWCTSVSTDNGSGSPSPINSSFCDTQGSCSSSCSS